MQEVKLEDCVIWDKALYPNGYGQTKHKGKTVGAHRVAYCKDKGIEIGDIDGFVVRHKCDIRACIQPLHLELGSSKDNVRDAMERGRRPNSKLTLEKAKEVWYMYNKGYKQREVAERLGVTQSIVSRILSKKIWKDSNPTQ